MFIFFKKKQCFINFAQSKNIWFSNHKSIKYHSSKLLIISTLFFDVNLLYNAQIQEKNQPILVSKNEINNQLSKQEIKILKPEEIEKLKNCKFKPCSFLYYFWQSCQPWKISHLPIRTVNEKIQTIKLHLYEVFNSINSLHSDFL